MHLKEKIELKQARKVPELFRRCTWDASAPFQREGTGEHAERTCAMAPREGARGRLHRTAARRLSSAKEPRSLEKPPAGRLAATRRELLESSSSAGGEGVGHDGTSPSAAPRAREEAGRPPTHTARAGSGAQSWPGSWSCGPVLSRSFRLGWWSFRDGGTRFALAPSRGQGKPAALSVSSPASNTELSARHGDPRPSPPRLPPAVHLVSSPKMVSVPLESLRLPTPSAQETLSATPRAVPTPNHVIETSPRTLAVATGWPCRSGRPCARTWRVRLASLPQHATCKMARSSAFRSGELARSVPILPLTGQAWFPAPGDGGAVGSAFLASLAPSPGAGTPTAKRRPTL